MGSQRVRQDWEHTRSDIEDFSTCLLAFAYLLGRNICSNLFPDCLTDLLLLSCKNSLNILDIGLISERLWFAIISFILWVVCTFLIVPFKAKKLKFFFSHTRWLVKAHQVRIKPMSPASGTQSLNHWTTMKFLNFEVQFIYFFLWLLELWMSYLRNHCLTKFMKICAYVVF